MDYSDAYQYAADFGRGMDRFGPPTGEYLALMENGVSASYEARALHYKSLYDALVRYTLLPQNLPSGWKIRVMDTAPALGQPGGSAGLVFLDARGKEQSVTTLTDDIKVLRHE